MQRRTALQALTIVSVSPLAQARDQGPNLNYDDYSGELPNIKLYGDKPALPAETAMARDILEKAPRNADLISTARYFESITSVNMQGEYYNAAWASRWNPVIVGFYKSTSLADKYVLVKGDTIAWCAAFLNWCLEAAGKPTTKSASSGSFRSHGKPTTDPRPGDIVVFKSADTARANAGFGHVGIFVRRQYNTEKKRDEIVVLGGNQKAGKRYSSINTSIFPVESSILVLHSYRRI